MPRSSWRYIFAAVGLAIGFLVISFVVFASAYSSYQYHEAKAARESARNHQTGPEHSNSARSGFNAFIQSLIASPDPKNGYDNEKRDLAAQEATAIWAFWMAAIGAGQLILSGIGIVYVARTLSKTSEAVRVAERSITEARRLGEIQTRAYIAIVSEKIVFKKSDVSSDIAPCIIFKIKNTGQTPARNINLAIFRRTLTVCGPKRKEITSDDVIPNSITVEVGASEEKEVAIADEIYGIPKEWIDEIISRGVYTGSLLLCYISGYIKYDDVYGINRKLRFNTEAFITVDFREDLKITRSNFRYWRMPDEEAQPAEQWERRDDRSWALKSEPT